MRLSRSKRIGLIFLSLLAVLLGSLVWLTYREVRQEKLNRALIAAIKHNDTSAALTLLAEGADPNSRDEPPQHISLRRLILDKLRNRRAAPSTAPTALLLACSWDTRGTEAPDNAVLVKALLDRGAAVEGAGDSPLLEAAYQDNTVVCTLLIERGANVNPGLTDGNSPLLYAAAHFNDPLIKLLINKGADVNAAYIWTGNSAVPPVWYETPLMAVQQTNVDDPAITELLLSRGAKVNGQNTSQTHRKWTPLHEAIRYGRRKSVRILLQYGADVNLKTDDGKTPLKRAREEGDPKIIQMLKQAGAKE